MDTITKRMYVDNTPYDKFLPNDLLTSIITANTPRGINYNKIDDKENLQDDKTRPVTENDFHNLTYREAIVKEVSRISSVKIDLIDKKAPLKTESGIIAVCTELLIKIKLRNLKHFCEVKKMLYDLKVFDEEDFQPAAGGEVKNDPCKKW
ncbi:hypothetical protein C1646_767060 [Rhizophagus diaphanus]|nr:hypothetical protein C1646_767060 [Rhizophagus diaphanus] [Rhizophagus sp. MUCL 43196]